MNLGGKVSRSFFVLMAIAGLVACDDAGEGADEASVGEPTSSGAADETSSTAPTGSSTDPNALPTEGTDAAPAPPPPNDDAGSPPPPTGDAGSPSTPPTADAGPPPTPPPPPAPLHTGEIVISQWNDPVPGTTSVPGSTVSASFIPTYTTSVCTRSAIGACSVLECSAEPSAPAPVNAGKLSFTGSLIAGFSLSPVGGGYQPKTQQAHFFAPGATLGVSAAGGTVPAFSGQVVAPRNLASLSSPTAYRTTFASPLRAKIPRTTDLDVKWGAALGSDADVLQVYIYEAWGSKSVTADCRFPVPAQSGVVPVGVTSKFNRSADASNPGTISVRPLRESELAAGDWRVVIRAIGVGLRAELVTY